MRRRDTPLDPQVAAELAQLDAALAGGRVDDAELEALVRDVRALTPVPDPRFEEQLAVRVAEGFPSPKRARPAWRPLRRRGSLMPALGIAAVLLVGVVVALATGGRDDARFGAGSASSTPASTAGGAQDSAGAGSASTMPSGRREIAPSSADRSTSTSTGAAVAPAPMPAPEAPDAQRRKVERAAVLALSTSREQLQRASDGVVRVTQALGGYVASSQVSTSDRDGTAAFRLRVPSDRLADAIARLSRLAHVQSLEQSAEDITGPFASATDHLLDARAERRGLQRALAEATDPDRIATLRARLRAATSRVASLQAQLDALRRRADLSTIDVSLTGSGTADGAVGGGWTPGDAGRAALRVLEVSVAVALVALAVAVPLGLLGALGLAVARAARRRRRDAALDVI